MVGYQHARVQLFFVIQKKEPEEVPEEHLEPGVLLLDEYPVL